jgi:hypothetical protein
MARIGADEVTLARRRHVAEQLELFATDQLLQRRETHRFPHGQPIERRGRWR